MDRPNDRTLKRCLDKLYLTYDSEYLNSDPLWFPRQYSNPSDQEVVALISALFAYGNVKQIFRSVRLILDELGPSPADTIRRLTPREIRRRFRGFAHRFNTADDVRRLIAAISHVLRRNGSIQGFFVEAGGSDTRSRISAFSRAILALPHPAGLAGGRYYRFLFPDPIEGGSACKRLNMFLRWVVRSDRLDLGLWSCIPASQLIMPVDTHVGRISRYIGLTARAGNDWKTAAEITESLARLNPSDPVRYDFAIARLGILRHCPRKRDALRCAACDLFSVCRL